MFVLDHATATFGDAYHYPLDKNMFQQQFHSVEELDRDVLVDTLENVCDIRIFRMNLTVMGAMPEYNIPEMVSVSTPDDSIILTWKRKYNA